MNSHSFSGLSHKTVIVTGGSKGIGAGIVEQFVKLGGARVAIADVDPQGEELADRWRKDGHEVRFYTCDVSRAADIERMIATVESDFGGVNVLVNNAGIFPRGDLQNTDEALWDRVIGINLKGAFLMSQAAVPAMIKQGTGGSIINIGSLHSAKGEDNTLAYAVSKGGLITMTRNLAHALAKHKIRVNCVHPGWVASEGEVERWEGLGDSELERIQRSAQSLPLGRMQTGTDIANAAVFLASELADQITGQMLAVDGGLSIRK
ncbi:SDR family NAD(P)-dependent oxidoreductase [Paenibacillus allorhizosphaerae]|uniref:Dihydroanticapsin 7-dehydrogenase n=1 Tax=Paenibacillus allorhizosphaerae TaxID=2849866 RepID=A0ABN7TWV5_9BACL|nr:SDR family oxidoreductase [Paenibacillus allorhizosphaerae]CAG7658060.1 Dihydroanticapsin 7-dehydrogenase [Paenibacillus allorhizosphaerae]